MSPVRRASAKRVAAAADPQPDLVRGIAERVDAWVSSGYHSPRPPSELTLALLRYWFDDVHLLPNGAYFQWYKHQRRAVETLLFLYEVECLRRVEQIGEYIGVERAPQRDPWPKFGLQMATGSGKTKVVSLMATWAHLHWTLNTGLVPGGTQLLIAPNLIVLERLLADFRDGTIFHADPLVPPEFAREWRLEAVDPDSVPSHWTPGVGYLVVTNIQKLYEPTEGESRNRLGFLRLFDAPPTQLDTGRAKIQEFLRSVRTPVLVFNDEAHHVHDEELHYSDRYDPSAEDVAEAIAWHGVLVSLQKDAGIAAQLDVSGTLFEETTRRWFRHTIFDYPLRDAIRDRVVKQPLLGRVRVQYKDNKIDEPIPLVDDSADNAWDKYSQLIQAGIAEWKKEQTALDAAGLGRKAILFVVCNSKTDAKTISERLESFPDPDSGQILFAGRVREIHIGLKEGVNDKDWVRIRDEVRLVDDAQNPFSVVVSVMMLKEGWDVRNVKVIVPLRPCDSRQLTEQLLGRGLRRMFPPYWTGDGELKDQEFVESLYVIRHPSFERVIKDIEDVIKEVDSAQHIPAATRVVVSPRDPEDVRRQFDIDIVEILGAFEVADDWVDRVDRLNLPKPESPFSWVAELREIEGIIRHEGLEPARSEADLRFDIQQTGYASIDAVITSYAEAIRTELRMSRYYEAPTKALVKTYLERCSFNLPRGVTFSLDAVALADPETQKIAIANIQRPAVRTHAVSTVGRVISEARTGREMPNVQLSLRKAAALPAFEALPKHVLERPKRTVFDRCCFDSEDELHLAELLDEAEDVEAWLWNDQQGVGFRIQYAYQGRLPYYYPDFLVKLTDGSLWIIETKGSIRERDRVKQQRAERYVDILKRTDGRDWNYLFLINDAAVRRQDISWWRSQGRTLVRDLIRFVENAERSADSAPEPSAPLVSAE